jgi:hypothetical protein
LVIGPLLPVFMSGRTRGRTIGICIGKNCTQLFKFIAMVRRWVVLKILGDARRSGYNEEGG